MSFTITDAFVQQFSGNVRFLAQQTDSRLRPTVMEDSITGESAFMEQMAPTAARKVIARHSDSPLMNTQSLRRRVTPYDYDWGDLVDREDKVRLLIDPVSSYAKNAAYSMMRGIDDEIQGAYWANAYTGHTGTTVVTWPNGNSESNPPQPGGYVVAVNSWEYGTGAANAGLTISKLIEAKMSLLRGEGDPDEDTYIIVGATQIGDLLSTTEVTNSDYASVKALNEGKIDTFMGFKFIHSERNQFDANGYARIPAYRKSAMGLGVGRDIDGMIQQRPDKRFSWYVYTDMSVGGTRLEEVKMVEIKCLNQ